MSPPIAALVAANGFFVGQDWISVFDPPLTAFFLLPQAWTLSIEIAFYAIAPWLNRKHTLWLVALVALSIAAHALAYGIAHTDDTWRSRFFPFELAWFLLGMLAYRAYVRVAPRITDLGYGAIALALLAVAIVTFGNAGTIAADLGPAGRAVAQYALQLALVVALPVIFAITRKSRIDSLVGELSYPIYLCHIPVIYLVLLLHVSRFQGAVIMAATVAVAVVLAVAVAPIERWRERMVDNAGDKDRRRHPFGE
jgi:peptidoglycan/LPS O-acetylase OafA/YrhL